MKFSTLLSLSALAVGLATVAPAQDALAQSAAAAETRLQASLDKLAAQRATIRDEKIPLARQLQSLQTEVDEVRRDADRNRRLADNGQVSLEALREEVRLRREELDYVVNLMAEYARSLDSRVDVAELPRYETLLRSALDSDGNSEDATHVGLHLDVVAAGLTRTGELIGGSRFEGSAVTRSGTLERGHFALIGPATYFASSQSNAAGLSMRGDSLRPTVFPVAGGSFDNDLRALVTTGKGSAPLDPTLGTAFAMAAVKETLFEHIAKGGIWMIPILSFAIISWLLAALKAFELFALPKQNPAAPHTLVRLLRTGDRPGAIHAAKALPGPAGELLQQSVKYSEEDASLIEEIQFEVLMKTQPKIMRLLPFISITAAVAPLLGLLGTVTGMINTFKMIQIFGTGDAKQLSSGISEALITTEFGLIVAIPSLLLYAFLSRRAKAYLAGMEKSGIAFLNGLKSRTSPDEAPEPVVAPPAKPATAS